MSEVTQKRFRDPAMLNHEERACLKKAEQGSHDLNIGELKSWSAFAHTWLPTVLQLEYDGWLVRDGDTYRLADDAPEFNIQTT